MEAITVLPDGLSAEQRYFAERRGATASMRATIDDRKVFLYREDEVVAYRWLVDRDGRLLDAATFPR